MKINAFLAGLGIAAAMPMGVPIARAYPGDPPGANCESNALGALYCDGPLQPDGSWTRCVDVTQPPAYHSCYHYDPAQPPLKLGQPDHHVGL